MIDLVRRMETASAVLWLRPGDHPAVSAHPNVDGYGILDTPNGGVEVTPGKFILTDKRGHWCLSVEELWREWSRSPGCSSNEVELLRACVVAADALRAPRFPWLWRKYDAARGKLPEVLTC